MTPKQRKRARQKANRQRKQDKIVAAIMQKAEAATPSS